MYIKDASQQHLDDFHSFRFSDIDFEKLDRYSYFPWMEHLSELNLTIQIQTVKKNEGYFSIQSLGRTYIVIVIYENPVLSLFCNCSEQEEFCIHQQAIFNQIIKKDYLALFFTTSAYETYLKKIATAYGLEQEEQLEDYFEIQFYNVEIQVIKKQDNLIDSSLAILNTSNITELNKTKKEIQPQTNILVLKEHKYYKHPQVFLYQSTRAKNGGLKSPLEQISSEALIWKSKDMAESQFFTALYFLGQNTLEDSNQQILAFKNILKNPLGLEIYRHDKSISENVSVSALTQITLRSIPKTIRIEVDKSDHFFQIRSFIEVAGQVHPLQELPIVLDYFIQVQQHYYFIENEHISALFKLFNTQEDHLKVHQSKFDDFKKNFLDRMEEIVEVKYLHIPLASPKQIKDQQFYADTEAIIYLEESGDYINLIPTMRYADVEVPTRSKRAIFGIDENGKKFLVSRNLEAELQIVSLIIKQHPYFEEQLEGEFQHFYLHRKHFLDQDWFLNVFEEWRNHNISIIGFNEIKANKLNPFKGKITIQVLSGQNWFNVQVDLRFGKSRASLKNLQKAIRNKSKFITLDDGTSGILPEEWLSRFEHFFLAGELIDDTLLQIAETNYSAIDQYFEEQWLSQEAKERLEQIKTKIKQIDQVQPVVLSNDFAGTLRDYQQDGLNWLNFLDEFNFGGCLADDMGLGKTIQIIAFILDQRRKVKNNCNLLVLPTTLIFNWKNELEKFAPSIPYLLLQGADRQKNSADFDQYELIVISYHNLLTDINYLKKHDFNYIFLDESQQIKNPNSQRYQAVSKLKSRNRIVITGTPIENSTMDLFAQLSFANPGLLGSKKYFQDVYTTPIDGFSNKKRLEELQRKVKPFILRRTKSEVAKELPQKNELILYCEMKPAQRHIYDTYEKEFREFISAKDGDDIRKSPMHVLKGLTKLRQICNSTKLLKSEDLTVEQDASKIETLVEQVVDKSPYQKIIIFSQFVSMLNLIATALEKQHIAVLKLTGQSKNRQQIVTQFQEDEAQRVILISLKAGGTGLNLTAASLVYLVDPWWNPAVETQAIDRAFRIGQSKEVTAIRLICPNTVEDKIMKLQANKTAIAENIISATHNPIADFMDKDRLLALFQ
ncbi:SNF2-related protein [Sphingobacterium sp. SRCM116780]|uniref:DEAD/DEAH box helicase n=1 Tax=Sphingobacterium sp. SRCM116780 TaxID=2907623 RepID=UPI001F158448|nr:DEAD/DEAH box helicase [Sphingobacterium sp. SRCM116780]UIR56922.1 SNF2-related protein [Sphingobacterium sp. SRCM116780]